MIPKPHTNIAPERYTQPVVYMTQAEIAEFEAAHGITPWIAGALNLLPALGYLYCRSWELVLAVLLVLPVLYFKSPWLFVWWWVGVCLDAYYCALAYNSRILREERRRHNDW